MLAAAGDRADVKDALTPLAATAATGMPSTATLAARFDRDVAPAILRAATRTDSEDWGDSDSVAAQTSRRHTSRRAGRELRRSGSRRGRACRIVAARGRPDRRHRGAGNFVRPERDGGSGVADQREAAPRRRIPPSPNCGRKKRRASPRRRKRDRSRDPRAARGDRRHRADRVRGVRRRPARHDRDRMAKLARRHQRRGAGAGRRAVGHAGRRIVPPVAQARDRAGHDDAVAARAAARRRLSRADARHGRDRGGRPGRGAQISRAAPMCCWRSRR